MPNFNSINSKNSYEFYDYLEKYSIFKKLREIRQKQTLTKVIYEKGISVRWKIFPQKVGDLGKYTRKK